MPGLLRAESCGKSENRETEEGSSEASNEGTANGLEQLHGPTFEGIFLSNALAMFDEEDSARQCIPVEI